MLKNNLIHIKTIIILITIMFSMSIKTGLILPLLFPHPSYIAAFLMVLVIFIMNLFGYKIIFSKTRIEFILIILFFIFSIYGVLIVSGINFNFFNIPAFLQPPILTGLFITTLLFTKDNEFRLLLKCYIIFCVIMSFSGVLASILINYEILDYQHSLWNLYDATNGRVTRDKDISSYTFPFRLGLVLTGSHEYNIFQFIYYRSSGWLHEPGSATLFVAPALVLLAREKLFSNYISKIFIITIIGFWITCASISSMLAFIILILFYMVVAQGSFLKLRRLLVFGIFIMIGYFYLNPSLYYIISSPAGGYESLLLQKFNMNGGVRIILNLFNPSSLSDYIYLILYIFIALVTTFFTLIILRFEKDSSVTFILILFYFCIYSFKGGYGHVYSSLFVLAFIFMFLRVYISSWNIVNKNINS